MPGDSGASLPGSFLLRIYDGQDRERCAVRIPPEFAAPFANRLLREGPKEWRYRVREPWFELRPVSSREAAEDRPDFPAGGTALTGERYVPPADGEPAVRLRPSAPTAHFRMTLYDFREPFFRGDYSAADIFQDMAERQIRLMRDAGTLSPEDEPVAYAVEGSEVRAAAAPSHLFPERAGSVPGVFRLPPRDPVSGPRFAFTRVAGPVFPERRPEDAGSWAPAGRGPWPECPVLIHREVFTGLASTLYLPEREEAGGFLLGRPFRLPGGPEDEQDPEFRWGLEITHAVPAQGARGTPALLLFTGDTWSQVHRLRDRHFPDRFLAGWYHSHLFEATDDFGLSSLDHHLHAVHFYRPWQVAFLVNLGADGSRELRCFQRGPGPEMIECAYGILNPTEPEERP